MGIRYSEGPISYQQNIRCDTSANMRADIDTVLLSCNWDHVRAVSKGFVYRSISPDGLTMKLLVQDQNSGGFAGPWIIFQVMTETEASTGFPYTILYANSVVVSQGYEMLANQCQMFLGRKPGPGIVVGDASYSFACGIPALAKGESSTCQPGPDPIMVFQQFWACGSLNPGGEDFRTGNACAFYDRCLNNTFFTSVAGGRGGSEPSGLQIFPFCSVGNIDSPVPLVKPATLQYGTGNALYVDAFVGWQFQIRGEMWDAFQSTATVGTLLNPQNFTDTGAQGQTINITAVPWNHSPDGFSPAPPGGGGGTFFSQLWLLTGPPAGFGFGNYQF